MLVLALDLLSTVSGTKIPTYLSKCDSDEASSRPTSYAYVHPHFASFCNIRFLYTEACNTPHVFFFFLDKSFELVSVVNKAFSQNDYFTDFALLHTTKREVYLVILIY